ncbi:hypothetical protein [Virgibacillus salexigens]|uniref:hypothetical protein n=1 Tax=Virgibacillus salexigens TaxID=61016 RepID=UPI001909C627|nr:hypothetical protein [Virgibacillus salexigens]
MRYLNNKDLFKVMRIVRKSKIKEKLLGLELPKDEEGNVLLSDDEFGLMIMFEVIEGVPDAEKEVFELLADVAGVKVEEIENDEFELLPEVIDHLKNQKKLVAFLKQAFNSMN